MTLPALFEKKMRTLLQEEFEDYLSCFEKEYYVGLRTNRLKVTKEEFTRICPYPIEPVPWTTNGFFYDANEQPAKHPYYYAGLYYIQEPSAMTPASLLPITPGDKVLDLCAAPGGKSTELGARLAGKGVLVSNDISNSRAKALLKNIEVFGIRNAVVLSEAPSKLLDYFEGFFDKILIDAPCSGEGMFRKQPSIMKNWEQYGVEYYNKLQREIILIAAKLLKPGGMMLYSTCTFSAEENEGTITYLLENHPEFEIIRALPSKEECNQLGLDYEGFCKGRPELGNGNETLKNTIRLFPHKIKGEGHFIALLHKRSDTNEKRSFEFIKDYRKLTKEAVSEEAFDFIKSLKIDIKKENLLVKEQRIYYMPEELPSLKGLRILRHGLLLGEMKKNRFEPSQALASALNFEEYDKVVNFEASDSRVTKYLKCESIDVDVKTEGYYLICVDKHPLGWAKISKNSFKNKYLPGWRLM